MTKKRIYRTTNVEAVDVEKLLNHLAPGSKCIVSLDIAKEAMVAGFGGTDGHCKMLVRFTHPKQSRTFLKLCEMIQRGGHAVEVAMEPTGVYGDSLRYQFEQLGFCVYRVDAVRAHAIASVLDGVPSHHDAKSCTLIAYLHAQGISSPWAERNEVERELRALMDERELYAKPFEAMHRQLHSRIARHFPELMDEYSQDNRWHLKLLAEYPSPAHIRKASEQAVRCLRAGSGALGAERVEHIVRLANDSLGVPMSTNESCRVQAQARHMQELRNKIEEVDERIGHMVCADVMLARVAEAIGAVTTAVIFADAGNPGSYASCGAFQKALGLNLKERSSGNLKGALHITKRGPGRARRYLFMAALRFIQRSPIARAWYQARASYKAGNKLRAVIAVMRKLARAIVHVARGAPMAAEMLFDVRRLPSLESPKLPPGFLSMSTLPL